MYELYPLTFETIFKEKIWGGNKIKTILGKQYDLPNCGETWEISAVDDNVSIVSNGPLAGLNLNELISQYSSQLVGEAIYKNYGDKFPLLIKFIDAQEDLSVQVHPDDCLAEKFHGQGASGKTEMWYIMQADKDANLIAGFSEKIDKETFRQLVESSKIDSVLNRVNVAVGDVFYIPAGRIHTIGKGILLAEIQQTSDLTYRIYDFDRKDDQGNTRELHVDKAAEALDFKLYDSYKTKYRSDRNQANVVVNEKYFSTNKWSVDTKTTLDFSQRDSFVILLATEGESDIHYRGQNFKFNKGSVYLIPAVCDFLDIVTKGKCDFLEVYVA